MLRVEIRQTKVNPITALLDHLLDIRGVVSGSKDEWVGAIPII
jgi:hypothetical protein